MIYLKAEKVYPFQQHIYVHVRSDPQCSECSVKTYFQYGFKKIVDKFMNSFFYNNDKPFSYLLEVSNTSIMWPISYYVAIGFNVSIFYYHSKTNFHWIMTNLLRWAKLTQACISWLSGNGVRFIFCKINARLKKIVQKMDWL